MEGRETGNDDRKSLFLPQSNKRDGWFRALGTGLIRVNYARLCADAPSLLRYYRGRNANERIIGRSRMKTRRERREDHSVYFFLLLSIFSPPPPLSLFLFTPTIINDQVSLRGITASHFLLSWLRAGAACRDTLIIGWSISIIKASLRYRESEAALRNCFRFQARRGKTDCAKPKASRRSESECLMDSQCGLSVVFPPFKANESNWFDRWVKPRRLFRLISKFRTNNPLRYFNFTLVWFLNWLWRFLFNNLLFSPYKSKEVRFYIFPLGLHNF